MKYLALIFLLLSSSAWAAPPGTITQYNALCNPSFPTQCAKPDTNGALPVTGAFTPAGTTDVNVLQVGGASVNIGPGTGGSATQRVILDSSQVLTAGSAGTPSTAVLTVQGITAGTPLLVSSSGADPCQTVIKTSTPISIAAATTTSIIAATSAKKTYICSLFLYPAGTNNVALVEDATGACASPDAGMLGGTTAATGQNMTAQAGYILGNGGFTVTQTASTNVNVCLITSGTGQLSGNVTWVQQ